ncbi:MAG TPA: TolC family protein [Pyrinomonadaceae bacterium]|nr:TolC family protein [Pyrinomonadaceae bacterium]
MMKIIRRFLFVGSLCACLLGSDANATFAQTHTNPSPQISQNLPETKETAFQATNDLTVGVENLTNSSAVDYSKSLNRVGIQTTQTLPISLNEAIRKTLENNNDIEIARTDVRIQETQMRSLLGTYDPVFSVTPTFSRSSSTGSTASNDFRLNAGFDKFIERGGGRVSTFFNNSQTGRNSQNNTAFNQTSSLGSSSSTTYISNLGVNYTQPLFRDFAIDNTRRQIKIQRKRLQQSDADFRRQTIDIIAQVQSSYWDLVFTLRDQQNRLANLNLARENLRQIEARIAAGAAAPLARAEVATELANRETDVLLATQKVSVTENVLKSLLLREPTAPEWSQSFVPTDAPVFSADPIIVEDAVKDAIDNRPELNRLRLQREINAIDIEYFRNQTKPRVDLNSTFSLGGLSLGNQNIADGTTIPQFTGNNALLLQAINETRAGINLLTPNNLPQLSPISNLNIPVTSLPNALNGGTFQSLGNLFRADSPTYSVGVTIQLPFRNRTAEANLAGARIQQEQAEAQTRRQEQIVIREVRNAVQAVETSRQRVLTARRARENAEIQLEGEKTLFGVGRSTTFLLFQRENALTNARNSEIRAETDYNKALSDLQRSTSTTFRLNNIEIESLSNDK